MSPHNFLRIASPAPVTKYHTDFKWDAKRWKFETGILKHSNCQMSTGGNCAVLVISRDGKYLVSISPCSNDRIN